MITDIASYLRYFDSVHRRTMRDVGMLPAAAVEWQPPAGEDEAAWGIGRIVGHIGASRLYFASAYRGEGWLYPEASIDERDQSTWIASLEAAAAAFRDRLQTTPDEWLQRRIALIDTPGELSGWRLLLMMLEHEVHHRSQLDTYAGVLGWPVPHIYDRSYESIAALQVQERAKHE